MSVSGDPATPHIIALVELDMQKNATEGSFVV